MALGTTKLRIRPRPPSEPMKGNEAIWEAYFRKLDEYMASLEARIKDGGL